MIAPKGMARRPVARIILSLFISFVLSGRAQPYVEVRAEITTTTCEEDAEEAAPGQISRANPGGSPKGQTRF